MIVDVLIVAISLAHSMPYDGVVVVDYIFTKVVIFF